MDIGKTSLIKEFGAETYRRLAFYKGDVIFEWNMVSDKFYISKNVYDVYRSEPAHEKFSLYLIEATAVHPDDRHILFKYIDSVYQKGKSILGNEYYCQLECRLMTGFGSYIWTRACVLALYDQNRKPYKIIGTFQDIDFKKRHQVKILSQAQRDSLTGLYNKGTSQKLIEECLEKQREKSPQALLLIDIDGFKQVNDHFGHLFGDAVIADIAISIRKNFRESDIIGRVGGDEFIVLVKDIRSKGYVAAKCLALLESLRRTYKSADLQYRISASVGAALSPVHGKKFLDLFHCADCALYSVKAGGKDQYAFYDSRLARSDYDGERFERIVDPGLQLKKSFEDNLVEYIFKLLYRNKDVQATVQLILELLGQSFNLDRVALCQSDPLRGRFYLVGEWHSPAAFVTEESSDDACEWLSPVLALHAQTSECGVNCDNVDKLPPEEAEAFAARYVTAFLQFLVEENERPVCCVAFEYCRGVREWRQFEYEKLHLIANILGTFLSKKAAEKVAEREQARLRQIAALAEPHLYVVDAATYELLFTNRPSFQPRVGELCYAALHETASPCKKCPLMGSPKGMRSKIKSARIDWQEGRETYAVTDKTITPPI